MRCLFYAMGGGRGHQTRARNIHAAIRKRRPDLTSLLLVPQDRIGLSQPGLQHSLSPSRERSGLADWVAQELESFRPDLLVVDTFPRGVMGELADLKLQVPNALVTRWVDPRYYRTASVWEALSRFDQVFWTEPKSDPGFPGRLIEPVIPTSIPLVRDDARKALKASDRALILVLGWGDEAEQKRQHARLTQLSGLHRWDLRFLCPQVNSEIPEVWRLLSGADLVVSASGYNAAYEIAQHRIPIIWVPQQRKVDDQALRASGALPHTTRQPFRVCPDGPTEEDILSLLSSPTSPILAPPPRGAEQLAEQLMGMVGSTCVLG